MVRFYVHNINNVEIFFEWSAYTEGPIYIWPSRGGQTYVMKGHQILLALGLLRPKSSFAHTC